MAPHIVASLTRQLRQLAKSPPDGIKYVASEDATLNEIYADIEGPGEFAHESLLLAEGVRKVDRCSFRKCEGREVLMSRS